MIANPITLSHSAPMPHLKRTCERLLICNEMRNPEMVQKTRLQVYNARTGKTRARGRRHTQQVMKTKVGDGPSFRRS